MKAILSHKHHRTSKLFAAYGWQAAEKRAEATSEALPTVQSISEAYKSWGLALSETCFSAACWEAADASGSELRPPTSIAAVELAAIAMAGPASVFCGG
jgi:hypothetical protein